MKTKQRLVSGEASVWAIPRTDWQVEQSEDKELFELEVRTDKPYNEGSVCLHTVPIQVLCPADIDMLGKAVETLKERQKEIKLKYLEDMARLSDRINSLMQITFDGANIDG